MKARANGVGDENGGALEVAKDIAGGIADEAVNHPGHLLASAAEGAAIGVAAIAVAAVAPEIAAVAGIAAAGCGLYQFASNVGDWAQSAAVVANPNQYSRAEQEKAHDSLHELGSGTADFVAGAVGAGCTGFAKTAIEGTATAIGSAVRGGGSAASEAGESGALHGKTGESATTVIGDGDNSTAAAKGTGDGAAPKPRSEESSYSKEAVQVRENIQERFSNNPARQQRFENLTQEFEKQAENRGLNENDKALFYKQINRLMNETAPGAIPMSLKQRTDLAEQVMMHATHPDTNVQGFQTCNVTTVERRLYFREPDKIAKLIADQALDGQYTTASGETIKLRTLEPDPLAARQLKRQADGNDLIKAKNSRDWSTKITNETLFSMIDRYISDGNKMLSPDELAYDSAGRMLGKLSLEEVTKLYDKSGKRMRRLEPIDQVYNARGKEITDVDRSRLIFDYHGHLVGLDNKGKAIEAIYDNTGKPITQLKPGEDAFNTDGKIILSRAKAGQITSEQQGSIAPFNSVRLFYNRDGETVMLHDSNGKILKSPAIYLGDLTSLSNQVTGKPEPPFAIMKSASRSTLNDKELISTAGELGDVLEQMHNDRQLPAVVAVRVNLFGTGGNDWHSINVDSYDPITRTLKFTDPQFSGSDSASVNDMFAMISSYDPYSRAMWKVVTAR